MPITRRNFANSASVGTINEVLNNTDSSTPVTLSSGSLTGWPATPCTAAVNLTLADEEVVLVTAISGANVTFTRGYDGSIVRSHTAGASLTHVSVAKDFDEANAHTSASSGVHGLVGAVVGTSDPQTLSNKTLTAPNIADHTNAQHDHSDASHGGAVPQSSISGLSTALGAKAADTSVVHLAGTETITGAKTFSATVAAPGVDATTVAATTITTATVAASSGMTINGNGVPSAFVGGLQIASGYAHITTDGSGLATIALGTTFPNTNYSFVCTPSTTGAKQTIMEIVASRTTSSVVVHVIIDGTTVNTFAGLNVSWIAIGG